MQSTTIMRMAWLLSCLPLSTLAEFPPGPVLFPTPLEGVRVQRNVDIGMRDGVRLATDLFWPAESRGGLPVVLIRTPYNKDEYLQRAQIEPYLASGEAEERPGSLVLPQATVGRLLRGEHLPDKSVRGYRWIRYLAAYFFASQGYVVAVQDSRGRFESEGDWTVQGSDVSDGYDTIDWLARQPWANGKVGMIGCSYRGDVQIFAAKSLHPALAAIIPQAPGSTLGGAGGMYHYFGIWRSGVLELANAAEWMLRNGPKTRIPPRLAPDLDPYALYETLPVIDMLDRAGLPPTDWPDLVGRSMTDPWWDQFGYVKDHDQFDVPALFINSWWDFGAAETLYQFNLFQRNARSARSRDNQFIVLSPVGHCYSEMVTENARMGELLLGDPRLDYWRLYLDWFDHWLRERENGVTQRPKVLYYLMGKNVWKSAPAWPVPGMIVREYFLSSGGRANSLSGDGRLLDVPPADAPPDEFVYDPANPVRTEGGFFSAMDRRQLPAGPVDQRVVESRNDVLVYTAAPTTSGLEITGPIEVVLHVSSTARDTDFTAKLVDVHPDGRALQIQEGIVRSRFREGYAREVWMDPAGIYELRINLGATAHYLAPGHALRLEISSSNFPRFARNLNTGGDNYRDKHWVQARNRIHHSDQLRSRLLLPIVPEAGGRPQ